MKTIGLFMLTMMAGVSTFAASNHSVSTPEKFEKEKTFVHVVKKNCTQTATITVTGSYTCNNTVVQVSATSTITATADDCPTALESAQIGAKAEATQTVNLLITQGVAECAPPQ